MYIEVVVLALIILVVMQYIGGFSINKFVDDNSVYFRRLKESDFEFYAKAKYGDAVNIDALFNARLKNALLVSLAVAFLFISNFKLSLISYYFITHI